MVNTLGIIGELQLIVTGSRSLRQGDKISLIIMAVLPGHPLVASITIVIFFLRFLRFWWLAKGHKVLLGDMHVNKLAKKLGANIPAALPQ